MGTMRLTAIVMLWVFVALSVPMSGCCCTMGMSDPYPETPTNQLTPEMIETAHQQDMIAIGISVMGLPGLLLLLPGVIFLQVGQSPIRNAGYRTTGALLASAWLVCFLVAAIAVSNHLFEASMDELGKSVLVIAGVCCLVAIPSIWLLSLGSRLSARDIEEVLGE